MDETYYPRSRRSLLELLAQSINRLSEADRRPILDDWGVVLSGQSAVPKDFQKMRPLDRIELLKALLHLRVAAKDVEVTRSRLPHTVLAWDNVIALPSDEPPTTTGNIPVIH